MGFLRNLASAFIPTSWELYAILFLAGLLTGGWGVHKLYEADAAAQMSETLKTNNGSFKLVNRAGSQFLAEQKRKADSYAKDNEDLRKRIANAPKCSVPVPASMLLRPTSGLPDASRPRSDTGSASPPLEADCGAVVLSCEDNRQSVCEVAADQADAIRALWKKMQGQINGKRWWER